MRHNIFRLILSALTLLVAGLTWSSAAHAQSWTLTDSANNTIGSTYASESACTSAPSAAGTYWCTRRSGVAVPASQWVYCGNEGQTCTFTGTRKVRYGTTTAFVDKSFTGSAVCSNTAFGTDPAPGIAKKCWLDTPTVVSIPPATQWVPCANYAQNCSFTGTRKVRFGTATAYVEKSFTSTAKCDVATFGADPANAAIKQCWLDTNGTGWTLTNQYNDVAGSGYASESACRAAATGTGTYLCSRRVSVVKAGGIGQAPTVSEIAGKPVVGAIVAVSNQVIENKHITNPTGPCIRIPAGVTNVIIRNNEIGPCGQNVNTNNMEGVQIMGSNVTIQRNVIHDASACVTAFGGSGAAHPLVVDRNLCYNIAGPMGGASGGYQGNFVQFSQLRTGTGQSKVTCNVVDGRIGIARVPRSPIREGETLTADHISMYNTLGTASNPVEIAYNRIRGIASGGTESGSGMQLGDGVNGGANPESGWYWVHHNTVVQVNGVGIGIAGGHDITIENNIVDNRGENLATYTGWPFAAKNFSTNQACYNHTLRNNRTVVSTVWAFNHGSITTAANLGVADWDHSCTYTDTGSDYDNAALTAATPAANFATPYAQCN